MYALTIFYIFVSVHYVQLCVQWGNILYFTTEQSQSKVEAKVGSGSLKNPKAEQLQMSRIDHTVNCYIKVVAHFFLKIVCNNTVIHAHPPPHPPPTATRTNSNAANREIDGVLSRCLNNDHQNVRVKNVLRVSVCVNVEKGRTLDLCS